MSCACVSVHEDMFVHSRSQFIFQLTCTKLVSNLLSSLEGSLGLRLAENSLGMGLMFVCDGIQVASFPGLPASNF